MLRRKLFEANVGEFDIQINEPKEVKEDSIYNKMKEGSGVMPIWSYQNAKEEGNIAEKNAVLQIKQPF